MLPGDHIPANTINLVDYEIIQRKLTRTFLYINDLCA